MTSPSAYPTSTKTEIFVSGTWTDVSAYRIGDLTMDWGISGYMPADKMGYIGGMKLLLNNNGGQFTPNGSHAMAGFEKGAKIRFSIRYGEQSYVRFKGKISGIGLPYNAQFISIVPVEVSDWFSSASKQRITTQSIVSNSTTADAARSLLTNMSLQPDNTDIQDGSETINAFFTNLQPRSTVYSELANLSLTEFAYIYLRKDKVYGETLVVEKRLARTAVSATKFPKPLVCSNWLTTENGVPLLASNNVALLVEEQVSVDIQATQEADIVYGENLINELSVINNPNLTDASTSTLFSLDAPIAIGAGVTLPDFKVSYKNPTGGTERVNGTNFVTMVTGTHYQMWSNSGGTGINLSSSLTFSVDFGSAGATFTNVKNNSATNGYITRLNIVGKAVYLNNPIEYTLSDQTSINTFELSPYRIDNKYQSDLNITEVIGTSVLNRNKDNLVQPQTIKLCANANPYMMMAFLNLDVGDLVPIVNSRYEFQGNCFIQNVKATVKQGGIIWFEWGLVDAPFVDNAYWQLETVGKSELGQTTYVSP